MNAVREESRRYEANIPRYHDAIEKDVEKKVSLDQLFSLYQFILV
jgi:hypothetical protein